MRRTSYLRHNPILHFETLFIDSLYLLEAEVRDHRGFALLRPGWRLTAAAAQFPSDRRRSTWQGSHLIQLLLLLLQYVKDGLIKAESLESDADQKLI